MKPIKKPKLTLEKNINKLIGFVQKIADNDLEHFCEHCIKKNELE